MDGMIFAAGLGTRLRPLTEDLPKALIEVGGVTQLERTIRRLTEAGCDRIVVNVHHHADRICDFLAAGRGTGRSGTGEASVSLEWPGAEIVISREYGAPLETGGGLKRAGHLFRGDRTILAHNVDVISSIDLAELARGHEESGALATLAVNHRQASRYLVFDGSGLCGRIDVRDGVEEWAREPSGPQSRVGFTGIQALSPVILSRLIEEGAFSIMQSYLRLAAEGARIRPWDVTSERWIDVGTARSLESARTVWSEGS